MLSFKIKLCVLFFICHIVASEDIQNTPNVWYIEPTINRNSHGATVAYSLNGTSWLLDITGVALKKVPIVYNKNGVITEDTIKVLNCSVQATGNLHIFQQIEYLNNVTRSTQIDESNDSNKQSNVSLCNDKTKWMLTDGQDSYVFTVFNKSNHSDQSVPKELVYGLSAVSFLLLLMSSCLIYCKCASPSASGMEDYHIVDICLTGCCKF